MPTSVQNAPGLQVAATADNERDGRVVTDFARQETLDRILAQLRPLLPGALLVTPATLVSASCAKGAYVLLAHLTAAHAVRIRSAAWPLAAGWHIYVGSANGPGGMRARIGRHLRTDKTIHWHIDRLTVAADALLAMAVAGGSECDIVARLAASGYFGTILPGFGSSDCRVCPSHLLVPLRPDAA